MIGKGLDSISKSLSILKIHLNKLNTFTYINLETSNHNTPILFLETSNLRVLNPENIDILKVITFSINTNLSEWPIYYILPRFTW